ncbi:MAG: HAD-IIB family hydrolase [Rubrivivax sp.]
MSSHSVTRPTPWSDCPPANLRDVCGVLTDIDDTLTHNGQIEPPALEALAELRAAGLPVMAITGRPMGWSEGFALQWPVAAIVAENGAVALWRDGDRLCTEFAQDFATREANAKRLQAVAQRILHEVPEATLARDSAGRCTDIAIDHSEFVHLGATEIEHVVRLMHAAGMNATVSSIHINGWYGEHDKLSGAQGIVRRLLGRELNDERQRWVYVGDSTNDQQMFGHFALSVGVANLSHFAAQLHTWPSYMTRAERGAGFAEVAQRVLLARA